MGKEPEWDARRWNPWESEERAGKDVVVIVSEVDKLSMLLY